MRDGLPCVSMRPHADDEWDAPPHVELTKDAVSESDFWDPACLDHEVDEDWFDTFETPEQMEDATALFDSEGNYVRLSCVTRVRQHSCITSIVASSTRQ